MAIDNQPFDATSAETKDIDIDMHMSTPDGGEGEDDHEAV